MSHSGPNGFTRQQHETEYLTVSELASLLRCSPSTVRNLEADGKLPRSHRTLGGNHRRFMADELRAAKILEIPESGEMQSKKHALYCRVSSSGQSENLIRQRHRMISFVWEKHGIPESELEIVMETKSAFSKRPRLLGLLDKIYDGKILTVFVEFSDRLARNGDSLAILQHACSRMNVKIVFAKKTVDSDDADSNADLVREILDVITVFSNRVSARKSAITTTITVEDSAGQMMVKLFNEHQSFLRVHTIMRDKGINSSKGKPFSVHIIKRTVTNHFKTKMILSDKVSPAGEKPESVELFFRKEVNVGENRQVYSSLFYEAYQAYCKGKDIIPLGRNAFVNNMENAYGLQITFGTKGYRLLKGVSLKRFPEASIMKTDYVQHMAQMKERIRTWKS